MTSPEGNDPESKKSEPHPMEGGGGARNIVKA